MRTDRISLVSSLAAAVRAVGLDGADHSLDRQHHSYLLRLASAHAWSSLVGPWLDFASGIRSRRSGRRSYRVSPVQTTGDGPFLNRPGALRRLAEGEAKRLRAWIEKVDCEIPIANRLGLPDQLIHPLL